MDRVIKTDKGIPKFTTDHYGDLPLHFSEQNIYNTNGADKNGLLGREYPTARTGREQVSYNKRGK